MTLLAMGASALGDRATVVAAQRGDADALERTLAELARELMPLAVALTGRTGDADRLLGDALSRVYERLGQLDDPSAILSWSRRVLVRLFLDERRWWKRRPQCSIESVEVPTPDQARPELLDVRDAVRALSKQDQALLVLHYWQRLSIAECAQELGIHEGTAKSRLSTALSRLRRRLGEDA